MFDEHGIYQPKNVQIKLGKNGVDICDESNSKTTKADEVKKKPKWLQRGHSENNILDRNFERRLTKSQSCLMNYAFMAQVMKINEPQNYAETSRKKEWNKAMEVEFNALVRNDTWDLVSLPKRKDVIGTKWVF